MTKHRRLILLSMQHDSPSQGWRQAMGYIILLALLGVTVALNGCATTQRTEPPAPIVDARRPPPAPAADSSTRIQPPEPARVYAYQPLTEIEPEPPAPGTPEALSQEHQAAAGQVAVVGTPDMSPGTHIGAPAGQPVAESVSSQTPALQPGEPRAGSPSPSAAPEVGNTTPILPAPETRGASVSGLQPPQLTPAVDALVQQAERQRQSSDYAGAAATLERALRLQSREGYLWNRLAHVRLEQGLATQAANLATRANDLSGDNDTLKRDNWRVIADARRRAGDIQGAEEAQRRAAGG